VKWWAILQSRHSIEFSGNAWGCPLENSGEGKWEKLKPDNAMIKACKDFSLPTTNGDPMHQITLETSASQTPAKPIGLEI